MDDEIWDTREPYDRRSAFIYLIMEADWKTGILPRRLTERFLAQTWRWTPAKVHRYIVFLKSVDKLVEIEAQIETRPKWSPRQLKICNWETYQKERSKPKVEIEAQTEAIRKEGKEEKKIKNKHKTLTGETKKPRSDIDTPLQRQKERAVEFWKKRFPLCKRNMFGVFHNALMGEKQFRSAGCTDISVLLELIDGIPGDIKDPVARLCDMVHRAPTYRE